MHRMEAENLWTRLEVEWEARSSQGLRECLQSLATETSLPFTKEDETGVPSLCIIFNILTAIIQNSERTSSTFKVGSFDQDCALLVLHRILFNPTFTCCIPEQVVNTLCSFANRKSDLEELTEVMEVVYFACINRISSKHQSKWCGSCYGEQIGAPTTLHGTDTPRNLYVQRVADRLTWVLSDDEDSQGNPKANRFMRTAIMSLSFFLHAYPEMCAMLKSRPGYHPLCRSLLEALNSSQEEISTSCFLALSMLVEPSNPVGLQLFTPPNIARAFNLAVGLVFRHSISTADAIAMTSIASHLVSAMRPSLVHSMPINNTLDLLAETLLVPASKVERLLGSSKSAHDEKYNLQSLVRKVLKSSGGDEYQGIVNVDHSTERTGLLQMRLLSKCSKNSSIFKSRIACSVLRVLRLQLDTCDTLLPPWWLHDPHWHTSEHRLSVFEYTTTLGLGFDILNEMISVSVSSSSYTSEETKEAACLYIRYLCELTRPFQKQQEEVFDGDMLEFVMDNSPRESFARVLECILNSNPDRTSVNLLGFWVTITQLVASMERASQQPRTDVGRVVGDGWNAVQRLVDVGAVHRQVLGLLPKLRELEQESEESKEHTLSTLCNLMRLLHGLSKSQSDHGSEAHSALSSLLGDCQVQAAVGESVSFSGRSREPAYLGLSLLLLLSADQEKLVSSGALHESAMSTAMELMLNGLHGHNTQKKEPKEHSAKQQDVSTSRLDQLVLRENQLLAKLTQETERSDGLVKELEVLKQREVKWQGERTEMKSNIANLQKREYALEQALENNNIENEIKNEALKLKIVELTGTISTLRQELDRSQKQIQIQRKETDADHERLESFLYNLRNENSKLTDELTSRTEELDDVSFRMVQFAKSYEILQHELLEHKKTAMHNLELLKLERKNQSDLLARVQKAEEKESEARAETTVLQEEIDQVLRAGREKEDNFSVEMMGMRNKVQELEDELGRKQVLLEKHTNFTRKIQEMSGQL